MKINYVNIKNETMAEYLKSAYVHTGPKKNTIATKPLATDFLAKSLTVNTIVYSFNVDFREHILFDNNNIQIGEVNEDMTFDIEVYNNSRNVRHIDEINIINLYGIKVSVPTLTIQPFTSVYLTVNIASFGESENNGFIQLVIDGEVFFITINYSRQLIFSYQIDRSSNLDVAYSFQTEIRTALSGKEYRDSKLDVCRFTCDYNYKLTGDTRRRFESEVINNKVDLIYLPMFFEKVEATASHTDLRIYGDFSHTNIKAGASVFGFQRNVQQIINVTAVHETYIEVEKMSDQFNIFFVYPLVKTRMSATVSGNMVTKDFGRYLITFDIDEYESEDRLLTNKVFEYETIEGIPFFKHIRRNTDEETISFDKKIAYRDNGTSIRTQVVENSTARQTKGFTMKLFNKNEISMMKDCFNKVKGMHDEFYIIKDDKTLILLESINKNDIIVRVKDSNSANSFDNLFFDYVFISYGNQKTLILKVNEIRKDENNREVLLIDPAGETVDLSTVNFMSYISRARFSSDTLSLSFSIDKAATTNIEIITMNK